MRLDLYLTQQGYCETRSKASQLIKNNKVKVNDRIITKNGFEVKETDKITVIENDVLEYVSRGGHKLEKAIEVFSIDMKDKVICDIGSSTGGFTDCALKHLYWWIYRLRLKAWCKKILCCRCWNMSAS